MKKLFISLVALVIVVGTIGFAFQWNKSYKGSQAVACTMEAKICPDGVTSVGRTGPNCEFAACPDVKVPTSGNLTLGIGKTGKMGAVTLTINKLDQDSRCPTDVECIWAGVVLVNITAKVKNTETLQLSSTEMNHVFEGYSIKITSVTPTKNTKTSVKESDYKITFHIEKKL